MITSGPTPSLLRTDHYQLTTMYGYRKSLHSATEEVV